MDSSVKTSTPQRPAHRRNASSRTNILKSFVAGKSRPASPEPQPTAAMRTKSAPFLASDHPHSGKAKPLGERQGNVQSPPSSPAKSRKSTTATPSTRNGATTKVPTKSKDGSSSPKKSKSSSNLSAMFAKMNRSSKDLSAMAHKEKDKENATPPTSTSDDVEAPIWAQFASGGKTASRPCTRDGKSSMDLAGEIARYTPQNYSPSKQRNFNGTLDQPSLRPTLNSRPQSAYIADSIAALGRRVSGHRTSSEVRRSEDSGRRLSKEQSRRVSGDRPTLIKRYSEDRKVSGSSTEQAPSKEKLNIMKRGGKVMAAVAALQGKTKEQKPAGEPELDPKAVDKAFEAVLDSRNIPEPQRQKMRSLTLRVKQDFIKQDLGSKATGNSPTETGEDPGQTEERQSRGDEDDSKSTKRSRARSRTFTFSKSGKRSSESPSKKQRSQSKSRPLSINIPKETDVLSQSTSTPTSPFGSLGRKSAATALPADYISYLKKHTDPTKVEVGRLHKLRILLRNETVAWVDSFLSLGGMTEIVGLLNRTMALEWREEHEDSVLQESLACLKGLCTTERAMCELEKVADELFPALLGMLFDEEKKGPAEYAVRTLIINVLFNFLTSTLNVTPSVHEHRARRILTYLAEPQKPTTDRPVDFVLDMHIPRPYKLWCREATNVTKEVFWIFLHHLNVVPLPRPTTSTSDKGEGTAGDEVERAKVLASTYTQRHFPGCRPPVPAAPYIGGVEWDATLYITSHLDLLNGLIASLPHTTDRNALRAEMQASGWEKVMGGTLRTCKEKFYSGVHDALRAWVAAAAEDGWETRFVREGPTDEDRVKSSPKKKKEKAPQLGEVKVEALPVLDLGGKGDDEGWLG